jgi:hypothetical protein
VQRARRFAAVKRRELRIAPHVDARVCMQMASKNGVERAAVKKLQRTEPRRRRAKPAPIKTQPDDIVVEVTGHKTRSVEIGGERRPTSPQQIPPTLVQQMHVIAVRRNTRAAFHHDDVKSAVRETQRRKRARKTTAEDDCLARHHTPGAHSHP